MSRLLLMVPVPQLQSRAISKRAGAGKAAAAPDAVSTAAEAAAAISTATIGYLFHSFTSYTPNIVCGQLSREVKF
jgi:hypothetical protein